VGHSLALAPLDAATRTSVSTAAINAQRLGLAGRSSTDFDNAVIFPAALLSLVKLPVIGWQR
jgi:hypothetical protein